MLKIRTELNFATKVLPKLLNTASQIEANSLTQFPLPNKNLFNRARKTKWSGKQTLQLVFTKNFIKSSPTHISS